MSRGRYERELVNALDAGGFAAMRCPASGSATARELPDVLALRPDTVLAIEVKTTQATTAYATTEEVDALLSFADRAGATAMIAAKFKRQGGTRSPYYLVPPSACRMTPEDNYGVPEADAGTRARFVVYPATDAADAEFNREE